MRSLSAGRTFWVAGAATIVLLALLVGHFARRGVASPDRSPSDAVARVVVLPFASRGDRATSGMGAEFAEMLAAAIDGIGGVRPVRVDSVQAWVAERGGLDSLNNREVARRFGARLYVTGTVHQGAGVVRARAELHRLTDDGPPVSISAEARSDRPVVLVDSLALQLLAEWLSSPADRLARAAAQSTRSLAALKAYLAGEQDRRAGRFAQAAESFGRAVKADSAFALAYYRLGMMTLAADLPWAEPMTAEENARRHEKTLGDRERLLLRAHRAFRRGDAETAEQIYRGLLVTYPDDLEAWRQLGETLFHYNALRARPVAEARTAFEYVLANEPEDWEAAWHLAQLDAIAGRTAEAIERFDRLLARSPAPPQYLELRALRAFAAHDARAEALLMPELRRADELFLHQIVWRSAVYLGDLAAAERVARLLTESSRPHHAQHVGRRDLAALSFARGRWRAAERELHASRFVPPWWNDEAWLFRAFTSVFAVPARPRAELSALRDTLRVLRPARDHGDARLTLVALLSIALRDTADANTILAELERREASEPAIVPEQKGGFALTEASHFPGTVMSMRAAIVRAAIAQSRGQYAAMLSETQKSFGLPWFGFSLTNIEQARSMERFALAEALRGVGQQRRAIDAYASFAEHSPFDLVFLGPSHLRRAELYEKLGEFDRAIEHYEKLVELWRDCDPELRPTREAARDRLEVLRAR